MMLKKQWIIAAGLVLAIAATNVPTLNAAQTIKIKNKQDAPSKVPVMIQRPDLAVKTPSWSNAPREGHAVGTSSILNIVVMNKGNTAAKASKVKVACSSLSSLSGNTCPASLSGTIPVSPLNPGKSAAYAWPPASSEKWKPGKYRLKIAADALNQVQESSEANNTVFLTFTVLSKSNLIKKMRVKPASTLQSNTDLEVVSISITPAHPVSGEAVTCVAVVKNSGKTKTPQVDSLVTFWDTKGGGTGGTFSVPTPPLPSLLPGQTHTLETSATFITLGESAGVSVKVDRLGKLREIDETNNEKLKNFKIQCKPELALYDYTKPKPANIWVDASPGKEVKVTVWVYNNAGCYSKAAKLSLTGGGIAPMTLNIPPINPRQRVGLPVTLKWDTAGVRHCMLKADATNTNDESIENNNEMELIVSVLGTFPETE